MYNVSTSPLVDGADGITAAIPISGTGVKYTQAVKVAFGSYFSLSYKLAGATPDVQIDIEESADGLPPVTEGGASANFVIPEGLATPVEADLNNVTQHLKSISPVTAVWLRLKLTGKNSNPTTTTFTGYISIQEQINR